MVRVGRVAAQSDLPELLAAEPAWSGWPPVIMRDTVASTMDEVRTLAEEGSPEGTVVLAREQRAGRGRHGRRWESAADRGVWLSVLLRPTASIEQVALLPLVVGLAVRDSLAQRYGVNVVVKWPNDVLVSSVHSGDESWLKVAGILAEVLPGGAVVVGVGVNIGDAHTLPSTAASLRASLLDAAATLPEHDERARTRVAAGVLADIAASYRKWCTGDWDFSRYRENCITIGRQVHVQHLTDPSGRSLSGEQGLTAVAVNDAGQLIVRDVGGAEHTVSAGDVSLAPPYE